MLLVYLIALLILLPFVAPLIPQRKRAKRGWEGLPLATMGLIFVNVLVFALTIRDGELTPWAADHFGLIPHSANLLTLFTHIFLHGDLEHIFFNMLGLWLFGPHIEEALGKLEYLLFFIGGGVTAGLMHVLLASTPLLSAAANAPLVGASGAIFAVLGLFAVRFWRAKVRVFLIFTIPAVWAVGLFGLYQLFLGIRAFSDGGATEQVANWAHVGGFLFGAVIAIPLKVKDDSRQEYTLEDAEAAANDNRLDEAAVYYRKYLEEKPDDPNAHRALGRVCVKLRQGEAAHRHFQDALRLYLKQEHSPANSIAVADVYGDACAAFEAFPLAPAMLSRIAGACEEAGQYNLAVRALSDLCRDHPQAKEAETGLVRLGKLHLQKLNQPGNAVAIFNEFLRSYPGSDWSSQVTRLLADANHRTA